MCPRVLRACLAHPLQAARLKHTQRKLHAIAANNCKQTGIFKGLACCLSVGETDRKDRLTPVALTLLAGSSTTVAKYMPPCMPQKRRHLQ